MIRTSRILIAAASALLALPAAAGASGVDVASNALRYTGGPEANHTTLSFGGGQYVVTDDSSVTITAGAGCANPENDNTAMCSGAMNPGVPASEGKVSSSDSVIRSGALSGAASASR